jgi:hypothetical protein
LNSVPEASGIAVSRRVPGLVWTHNDSGEPLLFGFGRSGGPSRVTVAGGDVRDWEDLALWKGHLYIADIGDNRGSRKRITLYRVPEPAAGATTTAAAEAFHAVYPDQPRDAEALLLTDQIFIVTKEVPPRLYRFPTPLKPGTTMSLQLVRPLNERIRITGASASPDGRWVALRANRTLLFYRAEDFATGGDAIRVDLTGLKEPQGEGVAFGSGNEIYLVSEAGGNAAAGVLTRLNCALPK